KLDREGIMRDIRAKRHFEKPSEKRRRKAARARINARRATREAAL
ncbi:MAG: 30S ribosomal protein S21, partial [Opitutae bacterium]|nr:30S ribosomal protein S21 [Opitutae bacterium]